MQSSRENSADSSPVIVDVSGSLEESLLNQTLLESRIKALRPSKNLIDTWNSLQSQIKDAKFEDDEIELIQNAELIASEAQLILDKSKDGNDGYKISKEKGILLIIAQECALEAVRNPLNQANRDLLNELNDRLACEKGLGRGASFSEKLIGGLLIVAGILAAVAFGVLILATQGKILAHLPATIQPILNTAALWMGIAANFLSKVLPFSLPVWVLPAAGATVGVAATAGGSALVHHGQEKGLLGATSRLFNNIEQKFEAVKKAEKAEEKAKARTGSHDSHSFSLTEYLPSAFMPL